MELKGADRYGQFTWDIGSIERSSLDACTMLRMACYCRYNPNMLPQLESFVREPVSS